MRKLIILIFVASIIGCCKQTIPEVNDPIFGNWDVYQVDSGLFNTRLSKWTYLKQLNQFGTIIFNSDSTGSYNMGDWTFNQGENNFLWKSNDYFISRIDSRYQPYQLIFRNGEPYAFFLLHELDSIDLLVRDYLYPVGSGGSVPYYMFHLNRIIK